MYTSLTSVLSEQAFFQQVWCLRSISAGQSKYLKMETTLNFNICASASDQ